MGARATTGRRWLPDSLSGATTVLVCLALLKVLVHLFTADNYGYFRDELYYIAASEHLDLGYVDFPPFVAFATAASRSLSGDSLVALHVFPVLAGAAVMVLTGLMARELGGGTFAQGLAALAVLVSPNLLVFGTWISMDAFDQLFWVSAAYVLLLILKRDDARLWLLFGLIAGFGLLTKVTMLYFGFAVFVGLLLTPSRRHLGTPWPWLGGVVAFVFLLPYAYWQYMHDWPTLGFWADYGEKVAPTSPLGFVVEQVVTMHPVSLPLWVAGLCYYLFAREGRPYRALGLVYVVLLLIFMIQNAKFYFLAPAYPMLFAAGGVVAERLLRRRWRWLKPVYALVLGLSGGIVASLVVLPVLPVETLASITGSAGGDAGIKQETREVGALPQNFADRFGWEEMTATVAGVYGGLPQEERTEACILTGNYGEAGAINFFGPRYGLPRAISGHNSFYIWGPEGCTGETVISLGIPREDLERVFNEVREEDVSTCQYCMPDENNLPVYVLRDPETTLEEAWPLFRHYD